MKYYLRKQELANQVNAKIEAAIGKQPLFYIGQTELVRMLQLKDIDMTREALVKIERGIQHITGSQLRAIRDCLEMMYDELLK